MLRKVVIEHSISTSTYRYLNLKLTSLRGIALVLCRGGGAASELRFVKGGGQWRVASFGRLSVGQSCPHLT